MIEVWRVDLRAGGEDAARLLSPDEAERAARFGSERARRAFVTTRGALRTLIGSYLGAGPETVTFEYGPNGKPEVPGVSFSVSHAGDVALVALGSGRIGVDVEEMRGDVAMRALARRFFTGAENDALTRLSGDDLVRGFYGCWTSKEAFVKAVGQGMSFGLDRVEVAVFPEPAALRSIDGDEDAARSWTLRAVDVTPGHLAAVAVDSPGVEVAVRDWPASVAA